MMALSIFLYLCGCLTMYVVMHDEHMAEDDRTLGPIEYLYICMWPIMTLWVFGVIVYDKWKYK